MSLVGYAKMLRALAIYHLDGVLKIKPEVVMSSSEVLTEDSRKMIRDAWDTEPFNVYAATETAGIASDCKKHNMHLYEDMVIAEVVDEKYRPVKERQYGSKLLVTVLFSMTIPLLRYEMETVFFLQKGNATVG
jgi:phenylacetate-CoA ligase